MFERGGLLWIFNMHPTASYADYRVGTNTGGRLRVVLNSDSPAYMGHGRVDEKVVHHTTKESWDGRDNWVQVYVPNRTAIVLAAVKDGEK